MKKTKITAEGQECRHCQTKVKRQTHSKAPKYKEGGYYFEWWFKCPKCNAMYMDESAKRMFDPLPALPVSPRFIARSNGQASVESSMRQFLSQPRPEPFVHGPKEDAHGDDLVPPWVDYPERQSTFPTSLSPRTSCAVRLTAYRSPNDL